MSKGNPILKARMTPDLVEAIEAQIQSTRVWQRRRAVITDLDISQWIRQAVREKLRKMERSRRGRKLALAPAASSGRSEEFIAFRAGSASGIDECATLG